MNYLRKGLAVLCLLAGGPLPWLAMRGLNMDVSLLVPVFALLATSALTTAIVLARRVPPTERRRRLRQAAIIWLMPCFVFLAFAWRRGQIEDAFVYLPLTILCLSLPLGFIIALSWAASALFVDRNRPPTPATSRLPGRLLTAAVTIVLIACLSVPWCYSLWAVDAARATRMKSRSRALWIGIVSASSEREPLGLCALWPRDFGFTGTESSTAYFQRLLADDVGQVADSSEHQINSDLKMWELSGPGLTEAASARTFGSSNNAWQVVCVGSNAPSDAPFLITRNVDVGDTLSPTSRVRYVWNGPLNLRRVVWLTRGGGCFEAPFEGFSAAVLFGSAWGYEQTPNAATTYRVMKP